MVYYGWEAETKKDNYFSPNGFVGFAVCGVQYLSYNEH